MQHTNQQRSREETLAHRDTAFGVRGGLNPTQRREPLRQSAGRAA
jgi:hypothetical protein